MMSAVNCAMPSLKSGHRVLLIGYINYKRSLLRYKKTVVAYYQNRIARIHKNAQKVRKDLTPHIERKSQTFRTENNATIFTCKRLAGNFKYHFLIEGASTIPSPSQQVYQSSTTPTPASSIFMLPNTYIGINTFAKSFDYTVPSSNN